MSIFEFLSLTRLKMLLLVSAVVLPLVSNSFFGMNASRAGNVIIEETVDANLGGTFSDDPENPSITVTIPPNALNADATLTVSDVIAPPVGSNQIAASSSFRVVLNRKGSPGVPFQSRLLGPAFGSRFIRPASIAVLRLFKPIEISIPADVEPVHPQIGEIAMLRGTTWNRMQANFYRASTSEVVTLTKSNDATYRAVHRTLQSRSGPDVERGRSLYFNETWGSEAYWGGRFQLHEVLNNVDPSTAVSLGAQIDITKVPQPIVDVLLGDDFAAKQAALTDPAITRALLQADAVVGLKGEFNDMMQPDRLTSVGLNCTLCHGTVTTTEFQILPPPAAPTPLPIGTAIIGPPNAGIDVGTILSFTPLVQAGDENPNIGQYQTWGPGNFDPRFLPDNPIDDGVQNQSQIPPLWNFMDLAEQDYAITWIGVLQLRPDNNSLASGPECGIDLPLGTNGAWGTDNAVIKNFEFGNTLPQWVFDNLAAAEQDEPGTTVAREDLLDIKAFLESLVSPPPGEFDEELAEEGMKLFYGKANCVSCHSSAEGTGRQGEYFTNIVENEPQGLLGLGIKVPGLRGLSFTAPYFHDGSAATLEDVVARYTSADIPEVPSTLTPAEQTALVEYLKSL